MTTPDSNPLLASEGLPHYESIRPEDVTPAVEHVLAENRRNIAATLEEGEDGWDGVPSALFEAEDRLQRAWGPVRHLHAVRDEPALRRAYNDALPLVTAYSTELSQNPELYAALSTLDTSGEHAPARQRWLDLERLSFRLGGAELPADERARFADIRLELSKLSSKFSENLLDATNAYELVLTREEDLAGLPETERARAAASAEAAGQAGAWRFTLQLPSYQAFQTFAESRPLREQLYRAYFTRATEGDLDNGPLMTRLLRLRRDAARLLGFSNWAERTLTRRMAETPAQVEGFLSDLAARTRPLAERELDELQRFAIEEGGPERLEAWDVAFFSERLRQRRLGFSEEEVREYFPEPRVLEGLFEVARRLYGLRFEARDDVETWDPAVRYFDMFDRAGELRGGLYMDLYAREGKRSGAWMDDALGRRTTSRGLQVPVAYLVCNFGHPIGDAPSLLTHREVQTLFHEFGHSLHHVVTRVDVPGVAGLRGVDWDAVEFPSQFHENWTWAAESLRLFARHWETDEPLPDALIERLGRARRFQAGLAMLRQLEFALFDLRLHTRYDPDGDESVQDVLDQVRSEVAVLTPPEWSRFQNGFGHIFAGGYAAGYYAYKWAEVMAADAFSRFEERGVFDPDSGRDFLEQVLERGGSRPPGVLFEAFRGRAPRVDALLRQAGIEA